MISSGQVTWLQGVRRESRKITAKPENEGKIKFIELFAGIGGFRFALEALDAKCVMASEIDREARETYLSNFGDEDHLLGDMNCIDAGDIPEFDILTGGFPCQSYSIAGHKRGLFDETGRLFFEMLRIIKHHHPKVLFLENVPNLLEVDNGNHWECIRAHI